MQTPKLQSVWTEETLSGHSGVSASYFPVEPCCLLLAGKVNPLLMILNTAEETTFLSSVFFSVLNGVVKAVEKTRTEEELRVGQGFTKEVPSPRL